MAPTNSPDFTLRNGRELTFDIYALTVADYDAVFGIEGRVKASKAYELIGKVCGLTLDEMRALPAAEFFALSRAISNAIVNPLANPT